DREDGGVMTHEQLDDGSTVNRVFSPRGELRAESQLTLKGDEIQKSYYETGRVKSLSWSRSDGTRIDVRLTPSGIYEGRQDTATDGSKVVTRFDSEGKVVSRWRVYKS